MEGDFVRVLSASAGCCQSLISAVGPGSGRNGRMHSATVTFYPRHTQYNVRFDRSSLEIHEPPSCLWYGSAGPPQS